MSIYLVLLLAVPALAALFCLFACILSSKLTQIPTPLVPAIAGEQTEKKTQEMKISWEQIGLGEQ